METNNTTFDEENVPKSCPGADTESAGKVGACEGCPNQNICSSGEAHKEKMAIMSGKGGVGKSTVSMLLARALGKYTNFEVGFLDIDLCGPSGGRLFGVSGELSDDGISVMSTEFLLNSKNDAIIWRGPKKNCTFLPLIQLSLKILNVDWGASLDYLIVDTPPGTTDEHLSLVEMFKSCPQAGAIMVYTSQEVALIDVRKQTNFLKKTSIPLLGFIENLSGFSCPKCKVFTKLFPDSGRNFGTITDVVPLCYCESRGLNPFEYIEDKNHPNSEFT
ncbi:LOW QUALITY PROTEIN: hypothetical protein MXB_3508 [Myxobolus squamalis]|nr:LOW QUALITY PROTEIN: hypothetical protein MXB_3508 [Myxobolus squamalis]